MSMRTAFIVALMAVVYVGITDRASAQDTMTVQSMLDYCEHRKGFEYGLCVGTLHGLTGAMQYNCGLIKDGVLPRSGMPAADTLGVTKRALVQTFMNWARDNPEHWNQPGDWGMMIAVHRAFPCD